MDTQRWHSMRDAYASMYLKEEDDKKPVGPHLSMGLRPALVLPRPSVTKVNVDVTRDYEGPGEVKKAYYTYPAGFDPTNREDITREGTTAGKNEEVEYVGEGMHRDAKTGKVVDKAEPGKTYYPAQKKKKFSTPKRKADPFNGRFKKNEEYVAEMGGTGSAPGGSGGSSGGSSGGRPLGNKVKPTSSISVNRNAENAVGMRGPEFKKPAQMSNLKSTMPARLKMDYEPEGQTISEEDIMINICDYLMENGFADSGESVSDMYTHMSDDWKAMILDELGKA